MATTKQRIGAATALATALAIPAEGLRRTVYYDPPGIPTVCRGHTGADIVTGKIYTIAECDALLTQDMRKAINAVESCAPGLPINVLAAFADAAFNAGPKIACDTKNSTAARMLKASDIVGACKQLLRWDKAKVAGMMVSLPGLTKRRTAESELCLKQ